MKNWKRLFSRQAPPDEYFGFDDAEAGQDAAFAGWLEKEATFEATPEFQADLRGRLQNRLLAQLPLAPASAPQAPAWWLRFTPVAVGLASIMIFILALVSGLSVPGAAEATPVAAVATPANGNQPDDKTLNFFYDQSTQDYVNLDDAAKTLGFSPRLPEYIPAGYKLDNAALTYVEPNQPVRTNTRPISPGPNTGAAPQGLQFELTSAKAPENNQVQVYQLRAPSEEATGPRFNIQGAQGFTRQTIQGAMGYFIQGARWRVNYAGPPPQPPQANKPNQSNESGNTQSGRPSAKNITPGAVPPRPNITPGSQGKMPFGFDGKRPPFMPPGVRPPQVRVAFGQAESNNPNRPGFYIDFQPQGADNKASRSLVWQKDGVLIVLVAGDAFAQNELQRIADSFKEHAAAN